MSYGETKVYFDGSHYIAIPHTTRLVKKRPKLLEEKITVIEESTPENDVPSFDTETEIAKNDDKNIEKTQKNSEKLQSEAVFCKKLTKKEYFEELYLQYFNLTKRQRKLQIIEKMRPYFDDGKTCKEFVELQFERKLRNLICRRVRMTRKANLANFNYFCTFTYDSNLHTEETFRKKLTQTLAHFSNRKDWKYMGVWERAPETNRLHFHGLFNIPKETMPGELVEHKDYSFASHDRIITLQNTYFNEKFGRSDFKEIDERENKLGNALSYLMKYIEKSGERIVYSKRLYQYFISDIFDDDIITTIGQEDTKLLLFDDFKCWDEGVYIGKVSPEVIEQLRKCN